MTLTTDVASNLLDLAAQVAAFGWDNGVGMWAIHPTHPSGEITFEKLAGPEYPSVNPIELLQCIPPPPACYAGLVVSFECWKVEPVPVGATGERKVDVRYLIAVLRSQTAVVFEQVRDRKPSLRIAPADRPMAGARPQAESAHRAGRPADGRQRGVPVDRQSDADDRHSRAAADQHDRDPDRRGHASSHLRRGVMASLALCAVKGDPLSKPREGAQERTCQGGCGQTIIVSPTTLALPGTVTLMCHKCGQAAAIVARFATGVSPALRIAPGALRADTPDDRRRRNELEAHGFRDTTEDELRDMGRG